MLRKSMLLLGILFSLATPVSHADVILNPGALWDYTFTDPTGDPSWKTTTGVGGIWSAGYAPFSNVSSGDFAYNTYWPASPTWGDDLWARTAIDLTGYDLSTISWGLGVDNGFSLFVNGTLVASHNAEGFTWRWEYSGSFASSVLNSGINIIAVALEDHGGLTAFDMEITGTRLPTAVSEPSALALLGIGCLLAGLIRIRRQA